MNAKCKMQNAKLFVKNKISLFAMLGSLVATAISVPAQINSGGQQNNNGKLGTYAIRNARIVTVSGATIENGTIVIENGKIVALGATANIPAGADTIDGKGLSVYPGMIDAGTSMGLVEIPQGANGTNDLSEVGDNNPNERAITAVNPYSAHISVTRNNGITSVLSMPRNGVVVGQSAVINLQGSTAPEMALIAANALVVNFPRVATFGGFGGGFGRQSVDFNEAVRTRDTRIEELKLMFKEAEAYGKAQAAYAQDNRLTRPKTDLKMAALVPYVRGEKPIIFTAERDRDIRAVIKFADETKTKAIIYGGGEAWKSADLLKQKNIPVIFTNIYSLPTRDDDAYDSLFDVAGKLQKAGVKFCISTGDTGAEARDLPYHAGIASAFGLPKEEALKAVTLYPAQILGVADRVGSLEVGKMANVVVTSGDLLEPTTKILHLFINGRKLPLTSRHTELYEQFKDRKLPN